MKERNESKREPKEGKRVNFAVSSIEIGKNERNKVEDFIGQL